MTNERAQHFPEFLRKLEAKLDAGERAYGEASFHRDPADLIGELQAEALDLAGWGFVLFVRLEKARAAIAAERARRSRIVDAFCDQLETVRIHSIEEVEPR